MPFGFSVSGALPVIRTEPGAYVLAVRTQDDESKAYSLPSVTGVSGVLRHE